MGINFPFKKWDKTSLFSFGTKVPIFPFSVHRQLTAPVETSIVDKFSFTNNKTKEATNVETSYSKTARNGFTDRVQN